MVKMRKENGQQHEAALASDCVSVIDANGGTEGVPQSSPSNGVVKARQISTGKKRKNITPNKTAALTLAFTSLVICEGCIKQRLSPSARNVDLKAPSDAIIGSACAYSATAKLMILQGTRAPLLADTAQATNSMTLDHPRARDRRVQPSRQEQLNVA
jgi:hypothetical protein